VLDYMLALFTDIAEDLVVYPERMRENLDASYGLVFSQRVLLELIETGLSRQDAYGIVKRNAMVAWQERKPFLSLLLADEDVTSRLDEERLRSLFDYGYYLRNASSTFERLGLA